ncbi:MAG: hypothetical protein IH987_18605 [Planctomycetes bacterium]|nr:hypothetical protein [Planctomycetota bacterium]
MSVSPSPLKRSRASETRKTQRLAILLVVFLMQPGTADDHVLSKRPQPWQRRDKPILSALTTNQPWSRVTLYSPHVIRVGDKYRMWYIGNSSATRRPDLVMGLAESDDGIRWKEYEHNPILTLDDLPWGSFWQTPFVMFDEDETVYKMWFVSITGVKTNAEGRMIEGTQKLGYATSKDGIQWHIHPKPIFDYGRSPCVIKEGAKRYRMWMNSGPLKDGKRTGLFQHIYEFTSANGLDWTQAKKPSIRPAGKQRSIVYPFVIQDDGRYYMWHASHVPNGRTEIFCDESRDGSTWTTHHETAAFPASRDPKLFDGRYTSTPCVLVEKDRYLLYYSARDLSDEYTGGDGKKRRDGAGVYHYIGVAVCPRR